MVQAAHQQVPCSAVTTMDDEHEAARGVAGTALVPLGRRRLSSDEDEEEQQQSPASSALVVATVAARAITDNAKSSSSQLTAQMIMQKGKYGVAMFITNELAREQLQQSTAACTASSLQQQQPLPPSAATATATAAAMSSSTSDVPCPAGRRPVSTAAASEAPEPPKLQLELLPQFHPLDMSLGGDVALLQHGLRDPQALAAEVAGSHYLNLLLDDLLMPNKPINDPETIDWCKWLIAGGRIPDDFAQIGESVIRV